MSTDFIFPSNPIDGDTFPAPNGVIYIYDSSTNSWVTLSTGSGDGGGGGGTGGDIDLVELDKHYVNKNGDEVFGTLTFDVTKRGVDEAFIFELGDVGNLLGSSYSTFRSIGDFSNSRGNSSGIKFDISDGASSNHKFVVQTTLFEESFVIDSLGNSTFNIPVSVQVPTDDSNPTTKLYVDDSVSDLETKVLNANSIIQDQIDSISKTLMQGVYVQSQNILDGELDQPVNGQIISLDSRGNYVTNYQSAAKVKLSSTDLQNSFIDLYTIEVNDYIQVFNVDDNSYFSGTITQIQVTSSGYADITFTNETNRGEVVVDGNVVVKFTKGAESYTVLELQELFVNRIGDTIDDYFYIISEYNRGIDSKLFRVGQKQDASNDYFSIRGDGSILIETEDYVPERENSVADRKFVESTVQTSISNIDDSAYAKLDDSNIFTKNNTIKAGVNSQYVLQVKNQSDITLFSVKADGSILLENESLDSLDGNPVSKQVASRGYVDNEVNKASFSPGRQVSSRSDAQPGGFYEAAGKLFYRFL
jgi:hypothetical protein